MDQTMLKTFYSVETSSWRKKHFTFYTQHGELKLYRLGLNPDTNDLWLWLEIEDGIVIHAKFSTNSLEGGYKDGIPKTIEGWKNTANTIFTDWQEKHNLPPDAIYYGFTQEQIEESQNNARIRHEENRKKRELEWAEREKLKKEKEEKRLKSLADEILAGKCVGGEELVELARWLDVYVHPRTAGTLIKRVNWITEKQASLYGKGGLSNKPYDLYKEIREKLQEKK